MSIIRCRRLRFLPPFLILFNFCASNTHHKGLNMGTLVYIDLKAFAFEKHVFKSPLGYQRGGVCFDFVVLICRCAK